MNLGQWIARALSVVLDFENGRFYIGWIWVFLLVAFCVVSLVR